MVKKKVKAPGELSLTQLKVIYKILGVKTKNGENKRGNICFGRWLYIDI